jgi:hypothetical protein
MELICLVTQSQYFCVVETKIEKNKKEEENKAFGFTLLGSFGISSSLSISLSLAHMGSSSR